MSFALGPIHYLMFDKIKLVNQRRLAIRKAFIGKYDSEAEGIAKEAEKTYGFNLEDKPLDELIGDESIHGWLQDKVSRVELAESALVSALWKNYKADCETLALDASYHFGHSYGEKLSKDYPAKVDTPDAIQDVIWSYYLDGMPCDQEEGLFDAKDKTLFMRHNHCLHNSYWEQTKAPAALMCRLYASFLEGLLKGLNPAISFKREKAIAFPPLAAIASPKGAESAVGVIGNPTCEDIIATV